MTTSPTDARPPVTPVAAFQDGLLQAVRRLRRCHGYLGLLIAVLLTSQAASADLVATVDRTRISTIDLLTLTVRHDGRVADAGIDDSLLRRDFDIVDTSRSSSSNIRIGGGRRVLEEITDWTFVLKPKRTGRFTIPSFELGGERSQPLTIEVVAATAQQRRRDDQWVFFETEVDTNDTWVQAQILYTVRLYYGQSISGDFPPEPVLDNAVITPVVEERRFQAQVSGRRYYVLEKRYAIFPQQSGELVIPGEVFNGVRSAGGMFSRRERVSAAAPEHRVFVKPRAAAFSGGQWLPATHLEIEEVFPVQADDFIVGEPINRQLTLTADAVAGSLLPPFAALDLPTAKTYTDPPSVQEERTEAGISATRSETTGIVPTEPGILTLPEIRVPWWNTRTGQMEVAVVPPRSVVVAPTDLPEQHMVPLAAGGQRHPDAPPAASENPFWRYAAITFALLWLLTLVAWISGRRRHLPGNDTEISESVLDPARSYRRFEAACRKGDASGAESNLRRWLAEASGGPRTLADLPNSPELAAAIAALEQHLYRDDGDVTWDGTALLAAMDVLRKRYGSKTARGKTRPALVPLHPDTEE